MDQHSRARASWICCITMNNGGLRVRHRAESLWSQQAKDTRKSLSGKWWGPDSLNGETTKVRRPVFLSLSGKPNRGALGEDGRRGSGHSSLKRWGPCTRGNGVVHTK